MPPPANDPGKPKHNPDGVPTLLVPDETSQATLIGLFDALNQAGFLLRHRDGFEAEGTVAYDLTRPTDPRNAEMVGVVPTPAPLTAYEVTYQYTRNEFLTGVAFDAAVKILGLHMAVAVQHLLAAEAADPDFEEPGRNAMIEAMKTVEEQVSTAMVDIAWDHVEANQSFIFS